MFAIARKPKTSYTISHEPTYSQYYLTGKHFFADEMVTIYPSADLEDVVDQPWKDGLVSDTQWANGWLLWMDRNKVVWKMNGPTAKKQRVIRERTMVLEKYCKNQNEFYIKISFTKSGTISRIDSDIIT